MAGSIHASRSSAGASLVIGATLTLAVVAVALMAPVIAPLEFFAGISPPLAPPSAAHLMGTDDLGRDVLAGVVQGARTSLLVVIGVTLLASAIGLAVGLVAGYEGGI